MKNTTCIKIIFKDHSAKYFYDFICYGMDAKYYIIYGKEKLMFPVENIKKVIVQKTLFPSNQKG